MPNNWKTYKLGEIADITSSKRIFLADYVEKGIPFYRSKEIIEKANGLEVSSKLFIDEQKYFGIKEKFGAPKNGDLLISAVGERAGIPYCVNNDGEFYFKDGNLIWFKNFKEEISPKFLYYYIRTDLGINLLESTMIGSAQRALTIIGLKNIKINFPPLQEQKSIAQILSTIDDKIENNLAINKTLEEMAMALYKHWFVDFGPFQNGEFVDSELGSIPKGWEVKKIKDFGEIICGKTPSKKEKENYSEEGYPFIKIPDMHNNIWILDTSEKISEKGNKTQLKKLLPIGSINVSCIATVGLVSINCFPSHTNQQINSIVPNNSNSRNYLYLSMLELKETFLNEASGGSATLNMNTSTFSNIKILKPKNEVLGNFVLLANHYFEKVKENQLENQTLTQLRDTLLPKLISGEVRLKEFRDQA